MQNLMHVMQNSAFFPSRETTRARIDDTGSIEGECEFEGALSRTTGEIPFALPTDSAVSSVLVDAKPASTRCPQSGVILIELPDAYPAGSHHRISVLYSGTLGAGAATAQDGGRWYELQCSTAWHPFFGLGDGSKTRGRLELTIPEDMDAVGNTGALVRRHEGSGKVFEWDTEDEPSVDFSVIAGQGDFAVGSCDGVELQALTMPHVPYRPDDLLRAAGDVLRFHQGMLGPYPFRRLSVACPPGSASGNCAREGLVIAGQMQEHSPTGDRGYSILAHEISHMWWGLGVLADWSLIGFVEPLAAYSTIRAQRNFLDESSYAEELASTVSRARKAEESGVPLLQCTWSTPHSDDLRECKGACIFLLLEKAIGTERLDAALREFARRFMGRLAQPEDLRSILSEYAGEIGEQSFDDYFAGTRPIPEDAASYA